MYIDYGFYKTNWNGKASEASFNQLNIRATSIIDYYTFNRLKCLETVDDNIKYAICELLDELYRREATGGKEVTSETVGTYSITYATSQDNDKSIENKQKSIIKKWLGHTGLLYRGV